MKPRICVSVKANNLKKVSEAVRVSKKLGISLVELRLDYAGEKNYDSLLRIVKDSGVGCVATIRPAWDGGAYRGGEKNRLRLFEKALEAPFKYVDVEHRARILEDVSSLASEKGVRLIVSNHDWAGTPSLKTLNNVFSTMRRRRADIYKIVTMVRNPVDEAVLLLFLKNASGARVICFGMGEEGFATRILSPLFGGFMTYASYDDSLAPGQATVRMMITIYRRMGVW
ncbi:MAG: type I 3-dehydroquinate dehydratase [Thermoproteota archaeon]